MEIDKKEYDDLLRRAKLIDPVNYVDMVHDYILEGGSLKEKKYFYTSVKPNDFTIDETCNTCQKCNQVLPINCFRTAENNGKIYNKNICYECENRLHVQYLRNKYHNDPDFREKAKARSRDYRKNNPEKVKKAQDAYRAANPDRFKKYYISVKNDPAYKKKRSDAGKVYREKNKDKIHAYLKNYREQKRIEKLKNEK